MLEQKKLPPGKYEVVEIPERRHNAVVVQRESDSAKTLFVFKTFMRRYYPKGTTFESDKAGKIKKNKIAKKKANDR